MTNNNSRKIAYFSMEVGLSPRIPTYCGGLGVLAGDTLKAAADLEVPLVGITLLARQGHFFQKIDEEGNQVEVPVSWSIDDFLEPLSNEVEVRIEGRKVRVGCWRYVVRGISGFEIPLYFLTTDLPENSEKDREITARLYGGDARARLAQEIVLGVGGVRFVKSLALDSVDRWHMNEGHSALLTLELLRTLKDREKVEHSLVFTTHTPIPAGHDKFAWSTVEDILDPSLLALIPPEVRNEAELNMTHLALELSHYINGVSRKHAKISKSMFPGYPIHSITNGAHARTWVSAPFKELYDHHVLDWQKDPSSLRYAAGIPRMEIWKAHQEAKKKVIDYTNAHTNAGMDYDFFTLGWARRFTAYKRPDLLFEDTKRLTSLAEKAGPLQLIFAGKAHPKDEEGKKLIKKVFKLSQELGGRIKLAYLENYDMYLAQLMTAGVDVWLNTPLPPYEASGTSGMKAALNGVPHLSVLDGWWLEGCVEGRTGWSFAEARDLYHKLENVIMPMFYNRREDWLDVMCQVIGLNGSFFNASRMLRQYVSRAYF